MKRYVKLLTNFINPDIVPIFERLFAKQIEYYLERKDFFPRRKVLEFLFKFTEGDGSLLQKNIKGSVKVLQNFPIRREDKLLYPRQKFGDFLYVGFINTLFRSNFWGIDKFIWSLGGYKIIVVANSYGM